MRFMIFAYFFHFTRHAMIFPLIPLFVRDLGATGSIIGLTVGSFNLLSMFLAIPIGGLVDRFGTKTMLLIGVLFNVLYSLLLWLADSFWSLIVAQMSGGLGFLLLIVSSQAYVTHLPDSRSREKSFGYLSFTAAVGQTIGPFLGGFILAQTDFGTVFLWAILLALSGFCVLGMDRPVRERKPKENKNNRKFKEVKFLLSDNILLGILIYTFIIVFVINLRTSFLPILFQDKGLSETSIGFLLSVIAGSMTFIRLLISRIMLYFSRNTLLFTSIVLIFMATIILPMVDQWLVFILIMIVIGAGFGVSQPLSMIVVSDRSDLDNAGLAMGIRFTTITMATISSPVILGLVVDSLGLGWAFYLAAILLCLMGLIIASLFRR